MRAKLSRHRNRRRSFSKTLSKAGLVLSRSRKLALEPLEERALLDAVGLLPDDPPPGANLYAPASLGAEDHPLQEMFAQPSDMIPEATYQPGEILIKLSEQTRLDGLFAATAGSETVAMPPLNDSLSTLLSSYNVHTLEPVFPGIRQPEAPGSDVARQADAARGFEAPNVDRSELGRWHRLKLPNDADLQQAITALQATPEVDVAECNGHWRLADLPSSSTDPGFDQQWHFAPAKVPETWQYLIDEGLPPGGSRDVVIAVIDTGVDYTHEDLVGNMWVNAGEVPGNAVDDDGNGFVDDVHGCSVAYDARDHTGDPMDVHGHGTHVAGIAAGVAHNGVGGVGVAYNTQIMAVRVAQETGVMTYDDVAEGIIYAVDNGAEVINMSFGGYHRSVIIEDALSVAFSQAVLVAAAGNDGVPADLAPLYPAAYPWVLGVMASNQQDKLAWFTNYDNQPGSTREYEVAAPGVDIYSTLPGNQYAAWDGTSMATPIVSGTAALIRSVFSDRAVYSSRFIMGQIGTVTSGQKGGTPGEPSEPPAPIVDPPGAITTLAKPDVRMNENWLFDDVEISESNNGDGGLDAGETVHIGIELMNMQGAASQVSGTLSTTDPYVAIDTATASFSNMGPLGTGDNGFIYDVQGVLVGVQNPLVFTVDAACPNGHVAEFDLLLSYRNGWDLNDPDVYTTDTDFKYVVLRGRNVPTVISQDTELTSEDYWIVGGPVLIEEQATLTIREGTQVQWGAISDDPYNPGPQSGYIVVRGSLLVEGTQQSPVNMFPSYLVSGQTVEITIDGGHADLSYAEVRNPELYDFHVIDHGYFDWDYYSSTVEADYIANSIFHKFRGGGKLTAKHSYETCLFDAGWLAPDSQARLLNSVLLQDNENNQPLRFEVSSDFDWSNRRGDFFHVVEDNGYTYAGFMTLMRNRDQLATLDTIANYFGGHIACVDNAEEQAFLHSYWASYRNQDPAPQYKYAAIGLSDFIHFGQYEWIDGTPLTYTNWADGYPRNLPMEYSGKRLTSRPVWLYHPNSADTPDLWSNDLNDVSYGAVASHIFKLPGQWTAAELNAALNGGQIQEYMREHGHGHHRWNAFLSKYWDPNLSHWMRITDPYNGGSPTAYTSLHDNYWGTTSTELIDHAIIDYYDTFVNSRIEYGTPPEHGYETTYPFVESVRINGIPAETVPEIGAGAATFTVTFNRDMDTSIDPFVTFGPAVPYTDYLVQRDGQWLDARTWQATHPITAVTGEGYHMMRISGAVAADDPWLVSGYDVERFRFQVKTMGVAAMTLHATGQEGSIGVNWQQDDFDMLAGYHLYRSGSIDGTYERLNETIIPVGNESFVDTDVTPAVPMYYKFTVMTTDMTESDPSNVASAAALDTIPPVITHVPATSAMPGFGLRLTAEVTDNVGVQGVGLHHRPIDSTEDYTSLAMVNTSGDQWSVTIPGSAVQPPGVEYYITATDGISQVYDGTAVAPHSVIVDATPTLSSVTPSQGPVEGGTPVTLSGTLFQDGAGVEFGGVPAGNVVVLTSNQISCLTPPHFPAMVDVTVINPDLTQATLLNGFCYVDLDVVVSLPVMSDDQGAIVQVPLSVSNADGLRAADVALSFDPGVLVAQGVQTGPLAAGWTLEADVATPGVVTMSLASAMTVSGSGDLAVVTFEVVGTPTSQTALTIQSALLNDGAVTCELSHGLFTVRGLFSLSGSVGYYTGGGDVPGATLQLVGHGVHESVSDQDGEFSITDIRTGAYTLTPDKDDQVDEITAYDASMVLQAAAGLLGLSDNQVLAADVNRNGSVTSMDASYILEKSVDLIDVPFQGAGSIWDFVPPQRTYALLNGDLSGQDFTALLIGDVSGNWQAPGEEESQAAGLTAGEFWDSAALTLPDVGSRTGQQANMPLQIQLGGESVYSADLVLTYDAAELFVIDVGLGGTAEGMSCAANTSQPGVIKVGLAGAQPLAEGGTLLEISFQVVGPLSAPAAVSFETAKLNEGAITVALEDGEVFALPATQVVGRRVFYNNSTFDGNNAAANEQDDDAIADGKIPLEPGQTATFANYTSYSRGISGIMVDIENLANPNDLNIENLGHYFEFHAGNSDDPSGWGLAPAPSGVALRESPDTQNAQRVTLVWPDYAIRNQWLQVTVLADAAHTGLTQPDVFYFGNAVGESGNSDTDAEVNDTDVLSARDNPHNFFNPAEVTCPYDYNRDGRVNATDMLIARSNPTDQSTALKLIHPQLAPGESPGAKYQGEGTPMPTSFEQDPALPATKPDARLGKWTWLYEYDQILMQTRPSEKHTPAAEAVDKLLATYRL